MTTYVLAPQIKFGLSGTATYRVYTYDSGGLVAASTWSDNGSTLNANPVVLDANGRAPIYIQAGKSYRFIYKTAADVTIDDVDPVAVSDPAAGTGVGTSGTNLTLTGDLTVVNIDASGDVTIGDDLTVGGDVTITGDTISNGIKLTALAPGHRNGTIDASAAGNAITITYETMASATPSTTDPVSVARRHQTITNGSQVIVNQTGAVTLTIPSGARLGCAASEAVRIHIGLIRNAGSALELACWTASVGTDSSIRRFDPTELATSTAIGTGSDSSQTIYSTTARTSQPMVYIGYIEATSGATAGQWSSVDKIVNWEPGVPMPGDVIQHVYDDRYASASGTTVLPADDSIPQSDEGDQVMALAITCRSTMNRIRGSAMAAISSSAATITLAIAVFQDSETAALAATAATPTTSGGSVLPTAFFEIPVLTTSASTIKVRAGGSAVGTTYFERSAAVDPSFGAVTQNSHIDLQEIHV